MSVNNNVKINDFDLEEYEDLQEKKNLKKSIDAEKSGAHIKALLESNKLSQEKLMELLNRNSKETMTNVLSGKSVYDLRDYLFMAKLFNVSFEYIVGKSDFKTYQEEFDFYEKRVEKMIDYLKNSGYKEVTISNKHYFINGKYIRTDNIDEYMIEHNEIYESINRFRSDRVVKLIDLENKVSYISLSELLELFNDCLSNIKRRSQILPQLL